MKYNCGHKKDPHVKYPWLFANDIPLKHNFSYFPYFVRIVY